MMDTHTFTDSTRYKIVRFYFHGRRRILQSGLTLDEAQAWCGDPETSSTTCTSLAGRRRTKNLGRWFDGYQEE